MTYEQDRRDELELLAKAIPLVIAWRPSIGLLIALNWHGGGWVFMADSGEHPTRGAGRIYVPLRADGSSVRSA